ncbi:MAG: TAXI family TRAP transporter solute-binding subunit [Candidatus Competibacterales bacterium]
MKTNALLGTFLATLIVVPAQAQDDRSDWPDSIQVGTASQGGTYFVYGSGWANFVAGELDINTGAEVTGGPVQNAALVQTGDLEFAQVTMGPAFDAWTGQSSLAPGLEHDQLRAVFPMYQTTFAVVALASSDIDSMEDLAGKTVGVGPAGGTPGTYWPRFIEALGIDAEVRYGGASDLAGQLQDGLIDAFAFAAGQPIPAFSQLEAKADVNIFGFSEEQAVALADQFPVSAAQIPADIYTTTEQPIISVSMWNFAVANASVPESLVYEVTKLIMENHDRMMEIHQASKETLPENVDKNTFLPFHPGAVRWFEENGYDIPDELSQG